MMQKLNDRLRREDAGFTLIELMVVVLIIAILIAIAIPTFLGARGRAQDRAAQSSLRNTVTGAKAIFTDDESYLDADLGAMQAGEPSVQFVDQATASDDPPNMVSIGVDDPVTAAAVNTDDVFLAAAQSANGGRCWFIRDAVDPDANPGTWWKLKVVDDGDCRANNAGADVGFETGAAGAWEREPGDAEALDEST